MESYSIRKLFSKTILYFESGLGMISMRDEAWVKGYGP